MHNQRKHTIQAVLRALVNHLFYSLHKLHFVEDFCNFIDTIYASYIMYFR